MPKYLSNKITEFEVQVEAYFNLKKIYPNVRGEYQLRPIEIYSDVNPTRKTKAGVVDLAILDKDNVPILLIEVKRSQIKEKLKDLQGEKYSRLGDCGCIFICGIEEAKNILEIVSKVLN